MDLSYVMNYFNPVVMAGCLAVGYIVKKWIEDINNKYIPTIVFVLGTILNCIVNQSLDVEIIIAGAICGLASTGLHQAFKNLIEKEEK